MARMKRKWKWLILLCIPMLCFAVWILTFGGRQIPIDVIGEFSEKDVTEIMAAAKHELRSEIFPNFSWKSLKGMPTAIRRYSSIKLVTVAALSTNGAHVILWQKTNGVTRFSSKTNYLELSMSDSENERSAVSKNFQQSLINASHLWMSRSTTGWYALTPID